MSWKDHQYPHGPLVEVVPGIWQVTGSLRADGDGLPRNMVLWRLPSGGLCIHNGVALDDTTQAAVEALGPPELLIVPNGFHRADAAVYKARYPQLKVLAPESARAKVSKVVPVDQSCEDALPSVGVRVLAPDGLKASELVYRVASGEKHALIVTDMLFNLDHMPGFFGWIFRHITTSTGHFGLTRLGRWLMLKHGPSLATWLRAQADEQGLIAVFVGHGTAVTERVAVRLREAADRI